MRDGGGEGERGEKYEANLFASTRPWYISRSSSEWDRGPVELKIENYEITGQLPQYLLRTDINSRRKSNREAQSNAQMTEGYKQ